VTAVLTPDRARRRFVGLTALRWLPAGIAVPVSVLLATARGLSPADIGLCVAVYGAVTLVLELPTGGFADVLGHRTVLASAGIFTTAGLLTMAVADSVLAFAIGWSLQGVARALDSGPLEAWYVDAARAEDPAADVTRGLAQAGAADGAGLTVGAVLGGTLPLLLGGGGAAALAAPLVLAAGFAAVHVTAVLRPARGRRVGARCSPVCARCRSSSRRPSASSCATGCSACCSGSPSSWASCSPRSNCWARCTSPISQVPPSGARPSSAWSPRSPSPPRRWAHSSRRCSAAPPAVRSS
jgi:MFS family permease